MFDNFISLGHYCGVAAAMSKLGIRSVSGPFDWYISNDFSGVLKCLETDFKDFLKRENIRLNCNGMQIIDRQYGFHMGHEIKVSFEDEYDSINAKYMRRIDYFREQIKQKTCFIRAVYNEEELTYIQEHAEYINSIIKRRNCENKIVFIVGNEIKNGRDLSEPFYRSKASYKERLITELRKLFDSNEDLIMFILNNYDENKRYRNLVFDLEKENRMLAYRFDLITQIDNIILDRPMPAAIIIYGCGRVGKHFFQKIKNKCKVLYFIDKSPKEVFYEGVRIILYGENVDYPTNIPVVVTPCYEYDQIRESLLNKYGRMEIISLTDFCQKIS